VQAKKDTMNDIFGPLAVAAAFAAQFLPAMTAPGDARDDAPRNSNLHAPHAITDAIRTRYIWDFRS
jgi:hypothetical protein